MASPNILGVCSSVRVIVSINKYLAYTENKRDKLELSHDYFHRVVPNADACASSLKSSAHIRGGRVEHGACRSCLLLLASGWPRRSGYSKEGPRLRGCLAVSERPSSGRSSPRPSCALACERTPLERSCRSAPGRGTAPRHSEAASSTSRSGGEQEANIRNEHRVSVRRAKMKTTTKQKSRNESKKRLHQTLNNGGV